MSLKAILAAKGGNVISIKPTANLAAAVELLSTHRIGVARFGTPTAAQRSMRCIGSLSIAASRCSIRPPNTTTNPATMPCSSPIPTA
jgi:hypothetical protein